MNVKFQKKFSCFNEERAYSKKAVSQLSANSFLKFASLFAGALLIAHLVALLLFEAYAHKHVAILANRVFNLDGEANAPSFFSAFLLLLAAVLLFLIGKHAIAFGAKWKVLSGIILFLCLDEAVSIHEEGIYAMQQIFLRLGISDMNGLLSFTWIVPYFLLLLLVVFYFTRFVFTLPPTTRNWFIFSGFVYVLGALGFEMVGGYVLKHYGERSFFWYASVTVEETLEIFGFIFFNFALLQHLGAMGVRLQFTQKSEPAYINN